MTPPWQRAALNAFGLGPVYLSLDTTPSTLILHAARGYVVDQEVTDKLRRIGVRVEFGGECPDDRYFKITIRKS